MADTLPMYADIIDCAEAQTLLHTPAPPRRLSNSHESHASSVSDGDDDDEFRSLRPTVELTYRPRILALHGAQSNNNVTRLQLSNLHITDDDYDIDYLQGGVEVAEAHCSLDGLIQGPFYSWFDKDDSASVIRAVWDVVNYCRMHGPFDGIYGFSSGAVVASLVANLPKDSELRDLLTLRDQHHQVRAAHDVTNLANAETSLPTRASSSGNIFVRRLSMLNGSNNETPRPRRVSILQNQAPRPRPRRASILQSQAPRQRRASLWGNLTRGPINLEQPPFKFAILACAAPDISTIREVVGYSQIGAGSILLPSFHIIGMDDEFKSKSEKNASLYATREVRYMPGGHGVPRNVSLDEDLCTALRSFARFLGRPPLSRSDKAPAYVQMNKVSSVHLLRESQVALVKLNHEMLPEGIFRGGATIRGALSAQPAIKPFLYTSRNMNPNETTTYGDLLSFIDGGGGDLRALGVDQGEVVAYAAPPGGSAMAAVAFLSIGAQTAAAPLAPSTAEPDALDALDQFDAKHLILFDGVECPGVEAAFEKYAEAGKAKIHRASAIGGERPGLFQYQVDARTAKLLGFGRRPLLNPQDGTCLLLRTSGTTARPKGVPLTQYDLVTNGAIIAHAMVRDY